MIEISKYDIVNKLRISHDDFIVLYSSYPDVGIKHEEIMGREIFRIKNGNVFWQISIPNIAENELFWRDGSGQLPFGSDAFNGIALEGNDLVAHSFKGCVFSVCMETGEAKYRKWVRD